MRKFFAALFVAITLLVAAPVIAAVQTFEGVGEHCMDVFESRDIAQQRAKEKALRDAVKKAEIYLKSYSRSIGADLTDDEIKIIAASIIKIIDIQYENKVVSVTKENAVIVITATVKAQIDSDEINKYLHREK